MPALDVSILEKVFEAAASDGGDCAAPAYSDGRIEPLCTVFHARCHAAILAAIEAGVRKVTQALASPALKVRYVAVASPDSFANLNTPEDLERYRNA
jgi:molybdopterin-guanine dinucleotide biosynthesis protein A